MAPGHVESTVSVLTIKKIYMSYGQGAIWTPRGERRFTGIIIPSALEKKFFIKNRLLKSVYIF
jgi:hypothetical protein